MPVYFVWFLITKPMLDVRTYMELVLLVVVVFLLLMHPDVPCLSMDSAFGWLLPSVVLRELDQR